ncbi:MAG: Bcr/CflA family drug resistance efflux transporter [Rhodovulum sulfidophilum]|uniref:Bcr/CflA family efflux transporter n=1 Tax=Rhodovulum sulfidophilum TaxID=35806 RepID=A0A2W5PZW0_RHOSU|nr:MAG: Bcr/CflA family drug resistance efflux transporter [Rhodovulum sulfidophilum]
MTARRVSAIGGVLTAIGPVSMSIYTPAMPDIVTAFGTTEAAVKMTLTLYFGGFACAQLIAGPLSDALGRRPVTFAFMAIYCLASLVALFAPSVEVLMLARLLQGAGAAAGVIIARAVVRDLFQGDESSRVLNVIGIILSVGPAIAPTLGGLLLTGFGWRAIFATMVGIGVLVIGVTAVFLRETAPGPRRRPNLGAVTKVYVEILREPRFLSATAVIAGAVGALYAQATFLPFVLMHGVGLSPAEFGLGMLFQTGAYFAASLAARPLMGRFGAERLVAPGVGLCVLGGLGLTLLLAWEPSFLRVMVPVAIYAAGIGLVMPAMMTASMAPFPKAGGAAASMTGFIQMGSGLVVGSLGALMGDPVLAMATLIPLMGLGCCLGYLAYRRLVRSAGPALGPVPR